MGLLALVLLLEVFVLSPNKNTDCLLRLILFVISDTVSRYILVWSVVVNSCCLYLHFTLNTGQLSYFRSTVVPCDCINTIVNIRNDAGRDLKYT